MKVRWFKFGVAIIGGIALGTVTVGATQPVRAATMSISIALKPQDQQLLNDAVYETVDPTSANYHHYLNPNDIATEFGRSDHDITQFKQYFKKYKLQTDAYQGHLYLKVRGSSANLIKAFKAKYVVHGKTLKTTYRLPAKLKKQVVAVVGLRANKIKTAHKVSSHMETSNQKPDTDLSANKFSKKYGAAKFASHYKVDQLYKRGLTGTNQQIGLIVGSDFKMSDIKRYLAENGLSTDTSRIQKHYTGPIKDIQKTLTTKQARTLQIETTLDVDQAASVAPGAGIQVYIFPPASKSVTNEAAWLNGYADAIADNRVKQISSSFGLGNEVSGLEPGTSVTPHQYNAALNLLFQQAALQGMTLFNAAGDHGPYDNASLKLKQNFGFSVSPYEVQVGGTTLPFQKITSSGQLIKIPTERAWGKTYGLLAKELKEGIFAGGAGGFSRLNSTPRYQVGISGVNTFNAFQRLAFKHGKFVINKHPQLIHGVGHGRNLPDVSGNADQDTGYAIYASFSKTTGKKPAKAKNLWIVAGGTSFVSPQMAAANAVMNSGLKAPIGFWNPQIYQFAQQSDSPFTPLNSTTNNDNLYYTGQPGKIYNQATGLGTVNFDSLFDKFNNAK